MKYQTRQLLPNAHMPRHEDLGFAIELSRTARCYIRKDGDRYTVLRSGKAIHTADSVRGVVDFLRGRLEHTE